jgi:hypothetical protein
MNKNPKCPEIVLVLGGSLADPCEAGDLRVFFERRLGGLETYRVADGDLNGPTLAWPWTYDPNGAPFLAAIDEALWGLYQMFQPASSVEEPGGVQWSTPFEIGYPVAHLPNLCSWARAFGCLVSRGHREAFTNFAVQCLLVPSDAPGTFDAYQRRPLALSVVGVLPAGAGLEVPDLAVPMEGYALQPEVTTRPHSAGVARPSIGPVPGIDAFAIHPVRIDSFVFECPLGYVPLRWRIPFQASSDGIADCLAAMLWWVAFNRGIPVFSPEPLQTKLGQRPIGGGNSFSYLHEKVAVTPTLNFVQNSDGSSIVEMAIATVSLMGKHLGYQVLPGQNWIKDFDWPGPKPESTSDIDLITSLLSTFAHSRSTYTDKVWLDWSFAIREEAPAFLVVSGPVSLSYGNSLSEKHLRGFSNAQFLYRVAARVFGPGSASWIGAEYDDLFSWSPRVDGWTKLRLEEAGTNFRLGLNFVSRDQDFVFFFAHDLPAALVPTGVQPASGWSCGSSNLPDMLHFALPVSLGNSDWVALCNWECTGAAALKEFPSFMSSALHAIPAGHTLTRVDFICADEARAWYLLETMSINPLADAPFVAAAGLIAIDASDPWSVSAEWFRVTGPQRNSGIVAVGSENNVHLLYISTGGMLSVTSRNKIAIVGPPESAPEFDGDLAGGVPLVRCYGINRASVGPATSYAEDSHGEPVSTGGRVFGVLGMFEEAKFQPGKSKQCESFLLGQFDANGTVSWWNLMEEGGFAYGLFSQGVPDVTDCPHYTDICIGRHSAYLLGFRGSPSAGFVSEYVFPPALRDCQESAPWVRFATNGIEPSVFGPEAADYIATELSDDAERAPAKHRGFSISHPLPTAPAGVIAGVGRLSYCPAADPTERAGVAGAVGLFVPNGSGIRGGWNLLWSECGMRPAQSRPAFPPVGQERLKSGLGRPARGL